MKRKGPITWREKLSCLIAASLFLFANPGVYIAVGTIHGALVGKPVLRDEAHVAAFWHFLDVPMFLTGLSIAGGILFVSSSVVFFRRLKQAPDWMGWETKHPSAVCAMVSAAILGTCSLVGAATIVTAPSEFSCRAEMLNIFTAVVCVTTFVICLPLVGLSIFIDRDRNFFVFSVLASFFAALCTVPVAVIFNRMQ